MELMRNATAGGSIKSTTAPNDIGVMTNHERAPAGAGRADGSCRRGRSQVQAANVTVAQPVETPR